MAEEVVNTYAGALFIRTEAEIKRPVVLLSGERCPCACACTAGGGGMQCHACARIPAAGAGPEPFPALLGCRGTHQHLWRAGKAL